MARAIRILIADDHPVVREGLCGLIKTEPGMELVGEAADGGEAVCQARALQPDVILLDLLMPRKDGIQAIKEITAENPAARILVVTSFAENRRVFAAIEAGALGYLLKDASPRELIRAIRDVYRGESSLHPTIARKLIRKLGQPTDLPPTEDPLTDREVQVLRLVAQGLTNQEIGRKLVISERTAGTHISNILSKLHLANRTQAALYALREGLVSLKEEDRE
jgi:NarL family two-component system response regulator LiaR